MPSTHARSAPVRVTRRSPAHRGPSTGGGRRPLRRWAAATVVLAAVASTVGPAQAGRPAQEDGERAWSVNGHAPRYGSTVFPNSGESYREAFLRSESRYGQYGVVRYFKSGLPNSWSTIQRDIDTTPAVVSFRMNPSEVVAGRYDSYMRNWFAQAPKDRPTWWCFSHEPEDDIAAGHFSAAQYRAAWQHLSRLADQADNHYLRATLVLMGWTTYPNSGRDWRDYYPGSEYIDVLGWDSYNMARETGKYGTPSNMLSSVISASEQAGKRWGLAELGSGLVRGDNGSGRAAWLGQVADYAKNHGARFMAYFDLVAGVDFRLRDEPSRLAWRHETINGKR